MTSETRFSAQAAATEVCAELWLDVYVVSRSESCEESYCFEDFPVSYLPTYFLPVEVVNMSDESS